MFGLGSAEIFLVAVLAIILIGPKDLPKVARKAGLYYSRLKKGIQEIKENVEREIGE